MFPSRIMLPLAALSFAVFATPSLAQDTAKKPGFEYNAYMRLGVNTSANVLEEATDQQGGGDQPTSRHVHNPNYFWFRLGRTMDNGAQAVIKLDNEAQALPHETNHWGNEGDAEKQMLRVRDLYLELPVGTDSSIWAGSRFMEFEDIRLFDILNHFDTNGYGFGGKVGKTQAVLSFAKDTAQAPVLDANGNKILDASGEALTGDAPRKNATLLLRHEMSLGTNMAIKPMFKVDRYGAAPENKNYADTAQPTAKSRDEITGATGWSVGGVFSRWGAWGWANTHAWYESRPVDTTGVKSGKDSVLALGDSTSLNFGQFAVLTGVLIQSESFDSERQVYKIVDGALAKDGTTTAKSDIKAAIGAQPVYFVTDRFHAALDMEYTYKTKKVGANDYNQTLVTPILRYSLDKSTIANPQLYTSVTYGKYDWKAKKGANGKATDTLVTTQTGFECWF